jgi:DNA-binding NarL/FixJ family response regulator
VRLVAASRDALARRIPTRPACHAALAGLAVLAVGGRGKKEQRCKVSAVMSKITPIDGDRSASSVRVLVVEDFEPYVQFIRSMLGKMPELRIICEVADGLEAVQKAEELQPDLILLDIGLPTLNGIEAARRIRKLAPESKILFVSQESSADVVQGALSLGAGYVLKAQAGSELLAAVEAVLRGKRFVSSGLAGHSCSDAADKLAPRSLTQAGSPIDGTEKRVVPRNHEVQFYSDDVSFLVGLTRFIEAALEAGSAVIVVATESHRRSLLQGLQAHGVDIATATEQGRYIPLDAADTLSTFMEGAGPNRERFLSTFGALIRSAETAEGKHKRVVVFGEMVAVLCAEGRMKAAIELEKLGNELAQTHSFYTRCAYPMTDELKGEPYATICAEHSAVLPAET